jgi:hypothetical protein
MVSSIPEMDNRQGIEPDQSSPQAAALAAAQRQFAEQMPDLVATEHRDALAAARARQEVLGEEPDDDYAALVTQAADQVQQGYQDAYGNAGVEDEVATQAAIAQRKQFLGEPLATAESTAVEAADGIVEAKRKEYGRTINDLKDQLSGGPGWAGGIPTSAMQRPRFEPGQQVYGNDAQ